MSRTRRRFHYKPAAGKVARDGSYQRFDPSCRNHGSCPWCLSGRLHPSKRRAPIAELVKPAVAPRYDRVFALGVAWADSL